MVIPAFPWRALGGWGEWVCAEETGACGGGGSVWEEGGKGVDWRGRGRMDEEMGRDYPEISDGKKGG